MTWPAPPPVSRPRRARQVPARCHSTSARQALDRATVNTGAARITELDHARRDLADARALLPQIADPGSRNQLDNELTGLEQQANKIGTAGQQGSNEQNGDNGQPSADATSGQGVNPQDDPTGTQSGSDVDGP